MIILTAFQILNFISSCSNSEDSSGIASRNRVRGNESDYPEYLLRYSNKIKSTNDNIVKGNSIMNVLERLGVGKNEGQYFLPL